MLVAASEIAYSIEAVVLDNVTLKLADSDNFKVRSPSSLLSLILTEQRADNKPTDADTNNRTEQKGLHNEEHQITLLFSKIVSL